MRRFGLTLLTILGAALPALEASNRPVEAAKNPSLQGNPEDQWIFEPRIDRQDAFYDRELDLKANREIKTKVQSNGPDLLANVNNTGKGQADAILLAGREQAQVEALMVQRKYEDAKNAAEKAAKTLERFADVPEVARILSRIKTYHDQADDALTRDEAQAAFDGLGLKIQGIMWAQSGSRLVILAGEAKALGINERVKDCVIINIDSDRVDFRFHFKRKRFEFPRYVGEEVKVAK